jgi:hypothetical protein
MRAGDTLAVWRIDRLGRSLKHLIETITTLANRGIGFKSITENIDTTTSGGKLIFHIFGALAEFATVHAVDGIDGHPRQLVPGDEWNGMAVRLRQCGQLSKPLFTGELCPAPPGRGRHAAGTRGAAGRQARRAVRGRGGRPAGVGVAASGPRRTRPRQTLRRPR